MKRWKPSLVGVVVVGVLLPMCLIGIGHAKDTKNSAIRQNKARKPITELTVAQLAPLKNKQRESLLSAFFVERTADERHLIKEFESAKQDEVRASLAYLIGVYRMQGAVKSLAKHITLDLGIRKHVKELLLGRYPVVHALVAIGKPSIPEMLRLVETTDKTSVRKQAVRVIRHIEGPEISRMIFEMRIKAETDETKKKRLQKGLSDLRKRL